MVLDDKKARRILATRFPDVRSGTSLSLIVEAARRADWSEQMLRDAVSMARSVSRMAVVLHERALFAELLAVDSSNAQIALRAGARSTAAHGRPESRVEQPADSSVRYCSSLPVGSPS